MHYKIKTVNTTNKRTIGGLIKNEVRKQQVPITEFAKMIRCQRNNVYDIFKRSKTDIVQSKQISKVLNRNFFKELAENAEPINGSKESEEEVMERKAVLQFLDVVPDILHELGKSSATVFSKLDEPGYEDCSTPDSGLSDYFITFTMGETLKGCIGNCAASPIAPAFSDDGCMVEVCTNVVHRSVCVNVRPGYKTADEWYKFLAFVFEVYIRFGRR